MRSVKYIRLNPFTQTIEEATAIDLIPTIRKFIDGPLDFTTLINARACEPPIGIQMVCHDFGLSQPDQRFFQIDGYEHTLGGRFVFLGYTPAGDTVDCPYSFYHWLQHHVLWLPETVKFVRFDTHEEQVMHPFGPATQIVTRPVFEGMPS
jgi:hypothetical protein